MVKAWSIATLRALDIKYAKTGLKLHQRPFRAAVDILGPQFAIVVGGNPEVDKIVAAYHAMIPEAKDTWPGMGIGLAASVDQVRKVTVPVVQGERVLELWRSLGFDSEDEWWAWCRENGLIATEGHFTFADLLDLTYGMDDLSGGNGVDLVRWRMALSNLADVANNLLTASGVDTVIQPICLTVELALKAALIRTGVNHNSFMGKKGHDLIKLSQQLADRKAHRDDTLVQAAAAGMPPYVNSRYDPAALSRYQVVRLALAAQFVAASTLRRFSTRDFAGQLEAAGWKRPPLF